MSPFFIACAMCLADESPNANEREDILTRHKYLTVYARSMSDEESGDAQRYSKKRRLNQEANDFAYVTYAEECPPSQPGSSSSPSAEGRKHCRPGQTLMSASPSSATNFVVSGVLCPWCQGGEDSVKGYLLVQGLSPFQVTYSEGGPSQIVSVSVPPVLCSSAEQCPSWWQLPNNASHVPSTGAAAALLDASLRQSGIRITDVYCRVVCSLYHHIDECHSASPLTLVSGELSVCLRPIGGVPAMAVDETPSFYFLNCQVCNIEEFVA